MSLIDTLALAVLLTSVAIILKPYLDRWVMRKAIKIELKRSKDQLLKRYHATNNEFYLYKARQEQARIERIYN